MKSFLKILTFSFVFSTLTSLASAEEGHHSFGLQGGQVLLSSDVASTYGNALGIGAFFNYAASDWLEFQMGWLNSRHTGTSVGGQSVGMTQNAFNADILYNVDEFDIFVPYLKGGIDFVMHGPQDVVNGATVTTGQSFSGFGLNLGLGGQFLLSKKLFTALDFTYHSIFDVTSSNASNTVKVMQSYSTILLQLGYRFGGDEKK